MITIPPELLPCLTPPIFIHTPPTYSPYLINTPLSYSPRHIASALRYASAFFSALMG